MKYRLKRRRGVLGGLLILVLGAWGALIPFIGPYFDYQIGTTDTWHWSIDRLWLSILPGAAAVLGGLVLIGSIRRLSASFGGLLGLAAGIWFLIGPTMSMFWNGGDVATGVAIGDTGTRVLEWLGFFYGTGALITLFSAYELGFLAALPIREEPVSTARGPAEEPPRAAPPRRRRFRRRRPPADREPTRTPE